MPTWQSPDALALQAPPTADTRRGGRSHFEPGIVAAAAPICGMTDLAIDYHATRPDLRPYSEDDGRFPGGRS